MSTDGQGTKWHRIIAENFNRLSKAHERYRQTTTDGWVTAYSDHEPEFTFAKKGQNIKMLDFVYAYLVTQTSTHASLALKQHLWKLQLANKQIYLCNSASNR